MALTYSDSVLDFDLNILHQPGNETSLPIQNIKKNKAVLRLKERLIPTDSVIKRYTNKKLQLQGSQQALRKWKEEFQQARLDYTDALKKVADLENNLQLQKLEIDQLNQINAKLCIEKDQCEIANLALHSHINQLQLLIKKHEEHIKKLESENANFKKPDTIVSQDAKLKQEKRIISLWLQQKKILLNHIQIFRKLIIENKKPNKKQIQILKKYGNDQEGSLGSLNGEGDCVEEVNGEGDCVEEEPNAAQDAKEKTIQIDCQPLEQRFNSVKEVNIGYNGNTLETYVKSQQVGTKEKVIIEVSRNNVTTDFDAESEISNEAACSVDTGCGSSLASSDIEKGFFSPEYSENNSPLSIDSLITEKDIPKVVNVSTSPITVSCVRDVGTSPVKFFDCKSVGIQLDARHEKPKANKSYKGIEVQCDILSKEIQQPIDKLCKNAEIQCDRLPKERKSVKIQSKCVGTQHDEIKSNLTVGTQSDFVFTETNANEIQNSIPSTETQPNSPNISDKKKKHKLNNKQQNLATITEETPVQDEMDIEVTSILQEMRLGFEKISPISQTPNAHGTSLSISQSQPDLDIISQVFGLTQTLKNVADVMNKHGMVVPIANDIFAILQKKTASIEHNVPNSSDTHVNEIINDKIAHKNMEVVEIVSTYENNSDLQSNCVSSQSRLICQTTDSLEYSSYDKQKANQNLKVQNINSKISTEKESIGLNKNCEHQNNSNEFCKSRKQKGIKRDKITRLQKIRNSAMPKYKIRKETTPLSHKLFVKPVIHKDNKNTKPDQILNDKTAYEKALRVISEMRQKEKDTLAKKSGKKTILLKHGAKSKSMLVSEKQSLSPDVQTSKIFLVDNSVDIQENKQDDAAVTEASTSLFLPMTPITQQIFHENDYEHMSKINIELTKTTNNTKESIKAKDSFQDFIQSVKLVPKLEGHTLDKQNMKNVENDVLSLVNKPLKELTEKSKSSIENETLSNIKIQNFLNNSDDFIKKTFVEDNEKSLAEFFEQESPSAAIRQSKRLAKKRLSLDIDNRYIKRVKQNSLSSINLTSQDENLLPSNNSTSKQNTNVDKINIHALHNNLVIQLHRLPKAEINFHVKQKYKTQLNDTGKNIDKTVNSHNGNERISVTCYKDLDIFTENTNHDYETSNINENQGQVIQRGYFCSILEKYVKIKRKKHKPLSEITIKNIYTKILKNVGNVIILESKDINEGLKTCAVSFQNVDPKHFVSAVIAFLQTPKTEKDIICKAATPPAPPMAKSEQVLLYVIKHISTHWANIDIFSMILNSIEYKLFILNNTAPTFAEVESLSHFYAVLCRYTRQKNRLRMFIIDAMYCLSYKAIAVVQQCLDVWMHVLPLAHMGLAKSPLVMTLVYLLHFYRCDDISGRVQNLRFLLHKRYSYEMSDWNEMKILEMLKDAIVQLRDIPIEKRMLRMCLIVIAKRHGAEWCQKNIVKRVLVPRLEDASTPERVRCFCVGVLGAVLRPYPARMRVHAEIALNRLFCMLHQNNSPQLQEAIFTSMIYLSRHNLIRVIETLLSWHPQKVSPALEELLKEFVRDRPFKSWQHLLSKAAK